MTIGCTVVRPLDALDGLASMFSSLSIWSALDCFMPLPWIVIGFSEAKSSLWDSRGLVWRSGVVSDSTALSLGLRVNGQYVMTWRIFVDRWVLGLEEGGKLDGFKLEDELDLVLCSISWGTSPIIIELLSLKESAYLFGFVITCAVRESIDGCLDRAFWECLPVMYSLRSFPIRSSIPISLLGFICDLWTLGGVSSTSFTYWTSLLIALIGLLSVLNTGFDFSICSTGHFPTSSIFKSASSSSVLKAETCLSSSPSPLYRTLAKLTPPNASRYLDWTSLWLS